MNDDIRRALVFYVDLTEAERQIFRVKQQEFDSQLNESSRKEIREKFSAFQTGPRAGACPRCGRSN